MDGVVEGGIDFVSALAQQDERLADEALTLLIAWLTGDELTDRADEAERRWLTARTWHDRGGGVPALDRLLATANLALPANHDDRDRDWAAGLLEAHLERCLADAKIGEAIRTVAALLDGDVVPPERGDVLLELGDELLDEAGVKIFELAAESYCRGRFVHLRDAGRQAEAEEWMARAAQYAGLEEDARPADLSQRAALAAHLHMSGDEEGAADAYREIVDQVGLEANPPTQHFALKEGLLRMSLGDHARAAAALSALLPHAEAWYLTAVIDEEVAEAEQQLVETVDALAMAQAELGRWGDVVRTLDRAGGLRLRYRAALREHGQAEAVVALERELDAATRGGVAGDEDEEVSLRTRLLEEYRRVRKTLPSGLLGSPGVRDVAGALAPDEAVLVLEPTGSCTLAVAIAPDDGDEPRLGAADYDWSWEDWAEVFAGENGEGWVSALLDRDSDTDPVAALEWLLETIDTALTGPLRAELPDELRRLTVVPLGVLNLVPWWAVPSFADLEVVVAPSLSEVVRVRQTAPPPAPPTALVVANPTLDLPASGVASEAVTRRLEGSGIEVSVLPGAEATEAAFLERLRDSGLLHFAGHGRVERRHSALELHPGDHAGEDPFPGWMAKVAAWREPADDEAIATERWGDVEGVGRLYERETPGGLLERFLEHPDGTLAAVYDGDRLVRLSELWSGSDILVGDALRSCRLAVLCACESGGGAGRGDETPGLAAALSLAGVDTVVGSLWQVEEPFAALWVDLFYETLAGALGGGERSLEIPGLVGEVAERLRGMELAEAKERLFALADSTGDPFVRLGLEAYAERLEDPPFADAWRWAAFYVAGRPTVELAR